MHNKLKEIITKKRQDLAFQKKKQSLLELKKKTKNIKIQSHFLASVEKGNPGVIAEVKFASPSAGKLGSTDSLLERVKTYEKKGANAISLITELHFFHGKTSFVPKVKRTVSLPVLQKDFVIDAYQIYEAALLGSDALLFIARIVSPQKLKAFVLLAQSFGIEPVVEIVDTKDLAKAITTTTRIIAVNARDLNTFEVNIGRAAGLMTQIPVKYHKLGFSGIHSKSDISLYKSAGATGILIGTALMKEVNVDAFFSSR